MSVEVNCDECGRVEGPVGCPVCDAMSHAHISIHHSGHAMIEGWREDDTMGMPVLWGTSDNVPEAIALAIHHECPRIILTLPDPREVAP